MVGAGIYNFALSHALARAEATGIEPRHGRARQRVPVPNVQAERRYPKRDHHLQLSGDGERVHAAADCPVTGNRDSLCGGAAVLASMDGSLLTSELAVKIAYVFLTVAFVSPLVHEARNRFAEVLAGHEAQRLLLHRLLRTGEAERRRIAGELHDRGGGALFSLLHGLRRLREFVQPRDAAAEAEVDRLIRVTEETVHDLRTLLADLRPRLLDDLGLAGALRELLSRERALSGIPVSFVPDSECSLALYRVAQEAFTNIRRHSQAGSAQVRLVRDHGGWSLAIEDDGRGLDGNRTGLGLTTMRERVEALGRRFEIRSVDGAGTRVAAWVPEHNSGEGHGDSSLSR